ncbi:MAG: endonuclease/exonuclease/phosphatase family protein, partial [Planctomycetia bacterium]|nr:endonuclease/exonuclease/phosphatase family protein [Planctomycetia bacterium]
PHDLAGQQELAEKTGMTATFGPAIDFQGGKYGVGILSKQKPLRSRTVPLPGREERRVLLIAEFPEFVCFCTHFSLTPEDRLRSAEIIATELEKYERMPVFLAGDFNAEPGDAPIVELEKAWKVLSPDVPTFPADRPVVRIDFVFGAHLSEWMKVTETRVIDAPVQSDHRPVLVVVRRSVPTP